MALQVCLKIAYKQQYICMILSFIGLTFNTFFFNRPVKIPAKFSNNDQIGNNDCG
jgi:hypothetical protein